MKYRRIFTLVLICLAFLSLGILLLNFETIYYLKQNAGNLETINALRTDLNLGKIDINYSEDLVGLWPRIKAMRLLMAEMGNIPNYQAQKQAIVTGFQQTVNGYFTDISKYSQLDLSFIPSSDKIAGVDFQTAKNSTAYLAPFKKSFRDAVVAYNTAHQPLRWDVDTEAELAHMSVNQKIGQMFVFGIPTTSLLASDTTFLKTYQPGGVVLIGTNVSPNLTELTKSIQATNPNYLVAVLIDQEGGTVKRIASDPVGGARDIAKLPAATACEQYNTRAKILSDLGINWNLGIVADITNDPKSFIYPRVFGGDPSTVATQVSQAVKCTTQTLSTLKHFPGHGATNQDSHKTVPVINTDKATWESTALLPFATGMADNADSVMLGQLKLTALDAQNPATLSKAIVGYIRDQLRYDGILISDDMTMLETAGYKWQDALMRAIVAGDDMLLYSTDNAKRNQIMDYAISLVKNGTVSESMLDAHVRRILNAKNKVLPISAIPSNLLY